MQRMGGAVSHSEMAKSADEPYDPGSQDCSISPPVLTIIAGERNPNESSAV
jgi:hypothetical protein